MAAATSARPWARARIGRFRGLTDIQAQPGRSDAIRPDPGRPQAWKRPEGGCPSQRRNGTLPRPSPRRCVPGSPSPDGVAMPLRPQGSPRARNPHRADSADASWPHPWRGCPPPAGSRSRMVQDDNTVGPGSRKTRGRRRISRCRSPAPPLARAAFREPGQCWVLKAEPDRVAAHGPEEQAFGPPGNPGTCLHSESRRHPGSRSRPAQCTRGPRNRPPPIPTARALLGPPSISAFPMSETDLWLPIGGRQMRRDRCPGDPGLPDTDLEGQPAVSDFGNQFSGREAPQVPCTAPRPPYVPWRRVPRRCVHGRAPWQPFPPTPCGATGWTSFGASAFGGVIPRFL